MEPTLFSEKSTYIGFLRGCHQSSFNSLTARISPAYSPKLSAQTFERTVDGSGEGRDLYVKSLPLINALAGDLYVSATKAAMTMIGRPMGDPRPPRLPLPDAKRGELETILKDLGLLAEA